MHEAGPICLVFLTWLNATSVAYWWQTTDQKHNTRRFRVEKYEINEHDV